MSVCLRSCVHTCVRVSVGCVYARVCPCVSSCEWNLHVWACVSTSARPRGPVCAGQWSGCVLSARTGSAGCLSWAVCPQVCGHSTTEGLRLGSLARPVTVEAPRPARAALQGLLAFARPWLHV